MLWFNFILIFHFVLISLSCITIPKNKKKIKSERRIKLNHNIYASRFQEQGVKGLRAPGFRASKKQGSGFSPFGQTTVHGKNIISRKITLGRCL